MFGKNYDDEIKQIIEVNNSLIKSNNNIIESIKSLQKLFDSLQTSILQLAKVQAQHKTIITFLMNHASVDADAQEDLTQMMQEIIKIEKDTEKELKKADKEK